MAWVARTLEPRRFHEIDLTLEPGDLRETDILVVHVHQRAFGRPRRGPPSSPRQWPAHGSPVVSAMAHVVTKSITVEGERRIKVCNRDALAIDFSEECSHLKRPLAQGAAFAKHGDCRGQSAPP
jgi:hypothetical protein